MIILYDPFETPPPLADGFVRISAMAEMEYLVEKNGQPDYVIDRNGYPIHGADLAGFREPIADVPADDIAGSLAKVLKANR